LRLTLLCSKHHAWSMDRDPGPEQNGDLYFVWRFFTNLDGLRSPKFLPSISDLWLPHTSLTMTPCTQEARYVAGLEQSRTSQTPALTGSRYGSGLCAAMEYSPFHFAFRPGGFKESGHFVAISSIDKTIDTLASDPRVALYVLWHRNAPTMGAT
jgi:hypothetical protein